jgi:hypothetical protein
MLTLVSGSHLVVAAVAFATVAAGTGTRNDTGTVTSTNTKTMANTSNNRSTAACIGLWAGAAFNGGHLLLLLLLPLLHQSAAATTAAVHDARLLHLLLHAYVERMHFALRS